jgi:hypothetical protein
MTKEQELLFDYLLVYWQKLIDGFRLELKKPILYPQGLRLQLLTKATLRLLV